MAVVYEGFRAHYLMASSDIIIPMDSSCASYINNLTYENIFYAAKSFILQHIHMSCWAYVFNFIGSELLPMCISFMKTVS